MLGQAKAGDIPEAAALLQRCIPSASASTSTKLVEEEAPVKSAFDMLLLADNHQQGEGGVLQDFDKAAEYYERAGAMGAVPEKAYAALKKASINGIDTTRDGNKGHLVERCIFSQKCLATGYSCKLDPIEARRMYQRFTKLVSGYPESNLDTDRDRYKNMDTCTPSADAEGDVSTLLAEKAEMLNPLRESYKSMATHKQPTLKPIESTADDTTLERIWMRAKEGFVGAQDYMKAFELNVRVLDRVVGMAADISAQYADEYLADLRKVARLSDIVASSTNEVRLIKLVATKRLHMENGVHADASFYLPTN
ncbi:hypothetical protein SARC_02979 [Sphaeroforma arctica JP610]|uniref:Uncharacterized protein n=1 Tax=Sphaeroforma arctica JP610 TaxID=667725 RepID=A0A0L0G7A6_9EUKA|nr:hypothetical protein SARC_02979 [Sphaeroforma arctica JP610]KNC84804.1 hypothetical protein SARC_02979 [Sphaeroforma arctica JP610]|eukprot:XP_014158706.1 hypothetical protein SARC_02979 [Sphaeroforma arctica JP610]